jgi:hypothetical protein
LNVTVVFQQLLSCSAHCPLMTAGGVDPLQVR